MLWNYSVSSTLAHIKCRCGVGCKHRIFQSAAVGCISVIFFLSEMWAALQKQRWLEHMWVHNINSANITRWTGDIFTKSGEEKNLPPHSRERKARWRCIDGDLGQFSWQMERGDVSVDPFFKNMRLESTQVFTLSSWWKEKAFVKALVVSPH